ncbi:MAG: hypothetical protein ACI94Y_002707 [Maribacter sp.]|jgi:hypothetical protein
MLQKLSKGRFRKMSIISIASAVIGISLLLLSIQIHQDWKKIDTGYERYVIINKPVNILSTLGFSAVFQEKEIQDIKEQDFIQQVGAFQTNDFRVSLGSNRIGFRTDAFFESVPDEFVDVDYYKWKHYEDGDVIPIILSADYLALYNFGFAPSQGLPQFTANTINKVNLDIVIQGEGGVGRYKGNIIGFSQRLNSIIVPQHFLEFANKKYGSEKATQASRLILEVDNPKAQDLVNYAKKKGYEMNVNQAFGEETAILVQRSILLVSFIGILVLILTLIVFYLSYKLIIEERIQDIRVLFTQGYEPKTIAQHFIRFTSLLIGISMIISLVIIQGFHFFIAQQINQIGFEINSWLSIPTWIFALIMAILLLIGSRFFILNTMRSKYL